MWCDSKTKECPWARYTSIAPTLHEWKLATPTGFIRPVAVGGGGGALFHEIPNPMPGGPTHVINGNTGSMVYLGTYNASAEQMDLSLAASSGSILSAATPASMDPVSALLDHGIVYDWAAAGNAADGRLLIIAKLDCGNQAPSPCDTFVSLVRELRFDHATAH
jgi:hypothetical protein